MKTLKRNPNTGKLEYVDNEEDMTEEEKQRKKAAESFKRSVGRDQSSFKKLKRMITGE